MKTDKELYKLFAACPELLFEAANYDPGDTYKMVSITLKEFERRSDGFLEPQSKDSPVYFAEFQAYWDKTIYHRLALEMAAFGVENPDRDIRGILVFTDENLDKKTSPWYELTKSKKNVFHVVYLKKYLNDLEKKDPNNPLVSAFKPYREANKQILKKNAKKWYKNINESSLPDQVKVNFEMIFTRWMQERFKNLSYEEVLKMFVELSPLEETRSYKELVAIGKKEGKKEGKREGKKEGAKETAQKLISRQMARKFNISIQRVSPRLRSLPTKDIMELGENLLTMNSYEDAFQWITDRKRIKK